MSKDSSAAVVATDAPPPYSPNAHYIPYDDQPSASLTPTEESGAYSQHSSICAMQELPRTIPQQFPPIFHLYCQPFSRLYRLGEHQDNPLYVVTTHTGWSGNPDVVLHAGTSKSDPPLAAAEITRSIPTTLTIHLPALPGSGLQASTENLASHWENMRRRYQFSIEIDSAGAVREEFEWRHSYGSAIRDFGCARQGWKLVRMATGPPGGVEGMNYAPGGYTTSDGKEVVAVWTNVSMSMTKAARFAFIGTGASGLLGERWAVMTVITALLLWERERRQRQRNNATVEQDIATGVQCVAAEQ